MDNPHDTPCSPASPEIARPRFHQKTIFDGTKLSLEPSNPKTTTSICIVVFAMLSLLLSSCSSLNLGSPFSTPLGGTGFETPAQDEYQRCIHSDYPDECDQQKKLADTYKSLGLQSN
jgi:hypothetical protein